MTTPRLPANLPRLVEEFGGEMPGIEGLTELTITADITLAAAAPLSVVVNEAIPAGWPQVGWVVIDSEVFHHSAYNAGTKTFTMDLRAQQGTAAALHTTSAVLAKWLTRDQWNQVVDELIALATTGAGAKGAAIASAATLTLTEDGDYFDVTGTTTVTAISARRSGARITLQFSGALTLTHNATSLILQGATNLVTAAGDVLTFVSNGAGNWLEESRRLAAASGSVTDTRLGADVASTDAANTFIDGVSVSLGAGTYLITWAANIIPVGVAEYVTIKLWDGTTTWDARAQYCGNVGNDALFAGVAKVTLAATTTVKISFAYNAGGAGNGATMKAASQVNSPGNYNSCIVATKV